MAIYNDPELNEKLNGSDKSSMTNKKYCKYCGNPMVYSTSHKYQARTDQSFEFRWKNKICFDCFQEGKHKNDGQSDNDQDSRKFL